LAKAHASSPHTKWDDMSGETWFWLKMALVAVLPAFHSHNGIAIKAFAAGKNTRPHTFYRKYNEIQTLILIAVVILVVSDLFDSSGKSAKQDLTPNLGGVRPF